MTSASGSLQAGQSTCYSVYTSILYAGCITIQHARSKLLQTVLGWPCNAAALTRVS